MPKNGDKLPDRRSTCSRRGSRPARRKRRAAKWWRREEEGPEHRGGEGRPPGRPAADAVGTAVAGAGRSHAAARRGAGDRGQPLGAVRGAWRATPDRPLRHADARPARHRAVRGGAAQRAPLQPGRRPAIGGGRAVGGKSGKALLYDVRQAKKVAEVGGRVRRRAGGGRVAGSLDRGDRDAQQDAQGVRHLQRQADLHDQEAHRLGDGRRLQPGRRAARQRRPGGQPVRLGGQDRPRLLHARRATRTRSPRSAFRDDGNVLASASEDGTIRLWNMQEGTQIKAQNCARVGRDGDGVRPRRAHRHVRTR